MKTFISSPPGKLYLLLFLSFFGYNSALGFQQEDYNNFVEYKGEVVNSNTGDPVASAYFTVNGTNISTISNADGKFSLKIREGIDEGTVTISSIGYQSKVLPLEYFQKSNTVIRLDESVEELSEVSIFSATDPQKLVKAMIDKRGENYINDQTSMTAFYREAIRKRRRNVSLSEAVVTLHKQPNSSMNKDEISLIKARKSADYDRLDTLALKLRGGPFNALYLDVMKYPEFLFDRDELNSFKFNFNEPAKINDKYLYVVDFEQKDKNNPWLYGKLFIDAQTSTLVKALYSLNVDNRKVAGNMFVKKKPGRADVYPVEVNYEVNYRESDGKWYFGYGNAELEFVVDWKRKLFNTRYTVNSELAVTDWEVNPVKEIKRDGSFLNPMVVMADDVEGFYDVDFWGSNNIIEPDKSIQNAIDKIQKQLKKDN